ncbi:hypothetical protein TNIN_338231 [Trichonephila inaurata madagascariensis]|uniref:Uncharacterized protein n=1 Tax=Trichonephila inaurata madagascariensis TaxID=2747483 RepID=A0A8X6IY98_9ARAC|nr:hypothetical protein TNIN_338231 [Trichonephila inaurata madagascariensis]
MNEFSFSALPYSPGTRARNMGPTQSVAGAILRSHQRSFPIFMFHTPPLLTGVEATLVFLTVRSGTLLSLPQSTPTQPHVQKPGLPTSTLYSKFFKERLS